MTNTVGQTIEIVELRPQRVATIRRTVPRTGLGAFFMEVFPKLDAAIRAGGGESAGATYARYYNQDPAAFDTEAGIPFRGPFTGSADIAVRELPGGRAARIVHVGPYDTLPEEYARLDAWIAEQGEHRGTGPWESYVETPASAPPSSLRTEVYWPIGR